MLNRKLFYKVGLGGTFDTLHTGHIRLIAEALRSGKSIVIGITSDEFARRTKPYNVKPLEERLANLLFLLKEITRDEYITFEIINDRYGSAIRDPEMDAITVSIETLPPAFDINDKRFLNNLKPLHIIVIPMIRDGYGIKYSSRVLRNLIEKARTSAHR